MHCEAMIERLDEFRAGTLARAEHAVVAAHIADCPDCGAALAQLERVAALAPQLRIAAPADLAAHVLSHVGDHYGRVETVVGPTWVAFNRRGITMVYLAADDAPTFASIYEHRLGRQAQHDEVPARYVQAVQQAAQGETPARVPIDISRLPPFEQAVLLSLPHIPRGEVRPYAWLAREAGRPKAVRATGNALARNPVPLLLPCHRVVPTSGGVGNYAFGSAMKRGLLEREGVPTDELDTLARQGVRYIGCTSTHIYCLPTCRDARRVQPANRVPLANDGAAAAAGYRPCKHCKPALLAG
jgi:O-6-methylguanine DNA methyltransferase